MSAFSDPPRPDLRAHPRLPVNRRVKVLDGTFALEALMANISEGGAKLVFANRIAASDSPVIVDLEIARAHQCRVVWRKGLEIGVKFLKTQDLRGLVPGQFEAARRAWLAAGGR